jgi:thiosulfate oxidation carrier complex protein SoxZ
MDAQRRHTLFRLGRGAAFAIALGAGALRPRSLLASWNHRAFDARQLADALAALGVEPPAATHEVLLRVPDIAEDGAAVPLELESRVPGTEALTVLVDRNPWPCIAHVRLHAGAQPYFALRMRMGESSAVRAVARAGGRHYAHARQVSVTQGGCAGNAESDAAHATPAPAQPIRARASRAGGAMQVRVLMAHPMENGQRRDAAGAPVPEHFIRSFRAQLNGRTVLEAEFGRSVSANPLIGFRLAHAAAGDRLALRWEDSRGMSREDEIAVAAA